MLWGKLSDGRSRRRRSDDPKRCIELGLMELFEQHPIVSLFMAWLVLDTLLSTKGSPPAYRRPSLAPDGSDVEHDFT